MKKIMYTGLGSVAAMLTTSTSAYAAGSSAGLSTAISDTLNKVLPVAMPIIWSIAIIIAGYQFFLGSDKKDSWKPIAAAVFIQVLAAIFTMGTEVTK